MSSCFHCGLATSAAPAPSGRVFCCPGCEAVSGAIQALGLDQYYRLRDRAPERPATRPMPSVAVFDRVEEQARFAIATPDGMKEAPLLLEGLHCGACAWLIEQGVGCQAGVESIQVNAATRMAWLRWDPRATTLSAVLGHVHVLGYEAWPYDAERMAQVDARERRVLLRRLCIAGLGMMQVMMYAVPAYLGGAGDVGPDAEALMRWASLLLTLPVLAYSGAPFFVGAWRELRARRAGMDVPVALGLATAFAASAVATWNGTGAVYFDSVVMFVFLLSGSRYLEAVARTKSAQALRQLARVVPESEALKAGDRVVVVAGAAVQADGILEQAATVSEAWLTGEERSLQRAAGEMVLAGSVNVGDAFRLRVTRAGTSTTLSAMRRLMERALAQRPRATPLADRAASAFVWVVLCAAAGAMLAWWPVDPERATWTAIAVLIATCPCAFALATPAALTAAVGRLARSHVAVLRPGAIDTLARVQDIVFDKTGTLTFGRPVLREVVTFEGFSEVRARSLAAALARWSDHPLDRALATASQDDLAVERHACAAGQGLEASVDGLSLRSGRREWVQALVGHPAPDAWPDSGDSIAWLGTRGAWIAAFRFADCTRPEAQPCMRALEALGIRVHLLSGDDTGAVDRVAHALAIPDAIARVLPEGKLDYVRALQAQGRKVAMVGDGINDAPVLAQADVSIAMGSGADLAQLRADAVLLSDSLEDLVAAVQTARRARRVLRQNVAWSVAYNLLAIPLAAAGALTPLVASIGMSASSLLVVVNAARLNWPWTSSSS